MKPIASSSLSVLLAACITFILTACVGCGGSSPSALNMAGTWTVKTASTQGQGNFSATAAVSQAGQGLGVNGSTTLAAAPMGQVALSQTATALTGTITNSVQHVTFNFTGTLSSGNLTLTGSASCGGTPTESATINGSITSSSMQGTYTITRPKGCYYPNDAGTFTATKQ